LGAVIVNDKIAKHFHDTPFQGGMRIAIALFVTVSVFDFSRIRSDLPESPNVLGCCCGDVEGEIANLSDFYDSSILHLDVL
jgi:hypothetical protein